MGRVCTNAWPRNRGRLASKRRERGRRPTGRPMKHDYSIDENRRFVHVQMSGPITFAQVRQLVGELAADPRVLPGFGELIDLRDATTDSISGDDVRQLAMGTLDASTRRAFVTSDILTYGLARMFEIYRQLHRKPDTIAVFRRLDEAEAWLSGVHRRNDQ